jgi:hypothetical protein
MLIPSLSLIKQLKTHIYWKISNPLDRTVLFLRILKVIAYFFSVVPQIEHSKWQT